MSWLSQENLGETKKIFRLGVPIMITQLLWTSMPLVDNIMVARLGAEPLAALGIASTLYFVFLIFSVGILSAINPMVSQTHGAKAYDKIPQIVHHGLYLSVLLGIFFLAGLYFAKPILLALKQQPHVVEIGWEYIRAISFGVPAQVGFFALRQFSDGVEDPKPTVVLVCIAAASNLVLDYALINGHWGFPNLGVAGAGYATTFCNWFLFVGMLLYFRFAKKYSAFYLYRNLVWRPAVLKEILKIGVPLCGGMLAEVGYFSGTTLLMGLFGTTSTAAHQVSLNIISTTFTMSLGLGFAVCVRVGHHIGAGSMAGARRAGILGIISAALLGTILGIGFLTFRGEIVSFYTSDPEVVEQAKYLLILAALFQIFDGTQAVGIQALRGLKDTRIPFLFTIFAFWVVGMGLSVLLAFYSSVGSPGIWIGMIVALFVAAYLHQWRFRLLTRPA